MNERRIDKDQLLQKSDLVEQKDSREKDGKVPVSRAISVKERFLQSDEMTGSEAHLSTRTDLWSRRITERRRRKCQFPGPFCQ